MLEGRYGSNLVLRAHVVGAGRDGVERELALALAAAFAFAFAATAFAFLAARCGRLGALPEHVLADGLAANAARELLALDGHEVLVVEAAKVRVRRRRLGRHRLEALLDLLLGVVVLHRTEGDLGVVRDLLDRCEGRPVLVAAAVPVLRLRGADSPEVGAPALRAEGLEDLVGELELVVRDDERAVALLALLAPRLAGWVEGVRGVLPLLELPVFAGDARDLEAEVLVELALEEHEAGRRGVVLAPARCGDFALDLVEPPDEVVGAVVALREGRHLCDECLTIFVGLVGPGEVVDDVAVRPLLLAALQVLVLDVEDLVEDPFRHLGEDSGLPLVGLDRRLEHVDRGGQPCVDGDVVLLVVELLEVLENLAVPVVLLARLFLPARVGLLRLQDCKSHEMVELADHVLHGVLVRPGLHVVHGVREALAHVVHLLVSAVLAVGAGRCRVGEEQCRPGPRIIGSRFVVVPVRIPDVGSSVASPGRR